MCGQLIRAGDRALVVCNEPEHEHLSALRYQAALARRGVETKLVPMARVMRQIVSKDGRTLLDVSTVDPYGRSVSVDDISFADDSEITDEYSFAILLTNDYGPFAGLVADLIESIGIEQLNSADALGAANDKWETHERLRDAGVPMVKGHLAHDVDEARDAAHRLGYPVVVKELRGTQGNGVCLATDDLTLVAHCASLHIDMQPLLIEHYIECSASDKRVLMMNGRFVAAMERHAQPGDFRANISLGGTAEPTQVTSEEIEVTRVAAEAIGLRLIGSDIATVTKVLPGREYLPVGTAFCIEANAMPALADLAEIAELDCAHKVVEILFEQGK
jgi:ribosomal protein S6--L-glutamate ligase